MSALILTYHALGAARSPLWVSPRAFEAQLAALAAAGYRSVALADLARAGRAGQPLPPRCVAITFDDGYASFFDLAWPRLRHWGFGATVFLVTNYCGRDNRWPGQPPTVPLAPLLSWGQVGRLASAGCTFAPHTASHPALPALAPAAAEAELRESQQRVRERTGQPADMFAYPYGATSPPIVALARMLFAGAVGTRLGTVAPSADPWLLPRIDACYLAPALIAQLHTRLGSGYLGARQLLRVARRRLQPDWRAAAAPPRAE